MRGFGIAIAAVLVAAIAGAGAVSSPSDSPEAKWKAELKDANDAWAGRRLAILKIDDTVYLKDGQAAFLTQTAAGYKWTLTAPEGLVPSIKYANGKALLRMHGQDGDLDLLTQNGGLFALNPKADLKAQITQVDPGSEDLRVAVYNQDNPEPKKFKGVEYYPYAKDFVVTARFEPAAEFVAEDFQTSRGWWKRFYKTGEAVFMLNGQEQRLPFYASSPKKEEVKDLSAFFMDALTGKETYGVGRYIDIPVAAFPPKELTIDFNSAYNPNCARSAHYNCPQAKVTLAAEIRAGEKKPSGH